MRIRHYADRHRASWLSLPARMHAAENPIVPEGREAGVAVHAHREAQRRLDRGAGRGAGRQHLFHRHAVRAATTGMILRFDPGDAQDNGLHRRQRQGQRTDLRRARRPRGLRRRRLRRPPRVALGPQDRQEHDRGRPLPGQAIQRPQRPVYRHQGAHLFFRSALLGRRAARAAHRAVYRIEYRRHAWWK